MPNGQPVLFLFLIPKTRNVNFATLMAHQFCDHFPELIQFASLALEPRALCSINGLDCSQVPDASVPQS